MFWFVSVSMMEKTDMRHRHEHTVLVRRLNDIVIANRSAALGDVGNAALMCTFDVVTEGEESVRTECYARRRLEPLGFFVGQEYRRFLREDAFPFVRSEEIHALVGQVDVDGIVAVGAAHVALEGKGESLRALSQIPNIGLVSREARAMDA